MLDTREAFHFSSGITLAQSGMAEVGRVIPDITCLIRSTCSEKKQKQRFFLFYFMETRLSDSQSVCNNSDK